MTCECKENLVSSVEIENNLCFLCISKKLAKFKELSEECSELRTKIVSLEKKLADSSDLYNDLKSLIDAENNGWIAAERNLPLTQNPHNDLSKQSIMWLNGWNSYDSNRNMKKAVSVLKWSIDNLDHVSELAKGYNQEEIFTKLKFVVEKLRLYYND